MNITIIGAGHIGGGLGRVLAAAGHTICFGVRNPENPKIQTLVKEIGRQTTAMKIRPAAEFSDVLIIATPWEAVGEVAFHIADMKGKILIDCMNPVRPNPEWPLSEGSSAAEELQKRMPGFTVVKAFNTLGADNLKDLTFSNMKADTFVCSDNAEAKLRVTRLAEEIGFNVVDVGDLRNAELLESLAKLWITLAFEQGVGPNFAFKLLNK